MAVQQFLARIAGVTQQVLALVTSTGAADAGKIVATNEEGRLDTSLLPEGVAPSTIEASASENLNAGNFVNYHSSGGIFSVQLADNANNRRADGYVIAAVNSGETAMVYPLDGTNAFLSGLTPGSRYFLGTSGGVTETPLDETDLSNKGKLSQQLGIAKSDSELVTSDYELIVL